jgi:heme exporter protein A
MMRKTAYSEIQKEPLGIRVKDLSKSFGAASVLSRLDLTLERGKRLVVFGRNGSGKTTLLKLLSTRYHPDNGEIWINGNSSHLEPNAIRRSIGVVLHDPMLYEDMSCKENLRFFGNMFDLDDLSDRISDVLGKVNLVSQKEQKARDLSHGMQKRLSIAKALLHDPDVLLLDEPESGLDKQMLDDLGPFLFKSARGNRTIVMATHNSEIGLKWADEVAFLSKGTIVYRASRVDMDEGRFHDIFLEQLESAS